MLGQRQGRQQQKKEEKQKEKEAKKNAKNGEDGEEGEEGEGEKEEDKRNEQEQKADFDKGMQSGVEVVKTEGKTSEELAAEVKAKKQKYELAISAGVNAWEAFKRANRDSGR